MELVRWAARNKVSYFKCPLCRVEVHEVVRDGGGKSVARHTVCQLVRQQSADDRAAAQERARQQQQQQQQQQQAQQQQRQQQIADELHMELGSAAACRALQTMLIRMAKQRAPRPDECVCRADPDFADRYLAMVGADFPVTARLCSSDDPDLSVLARDHVYSLLASLHI